MGSVVRLTLCRVRFISAILAILVLVLSVQGACIAGSQTAASAVCCADHLCESEGEGVPEKEDCKTCNPFQSCSCCAMGVIVPAQEARMYELVQMSVSRQWSQRVPHFPAAVYADFWQPPKIA